MTKGSWSRVKNHKAFATNFDDVFKAKKEIEMSMECLKTWAKDYEMGLETVPDSMYDAQVRQLQRQKEEHPNDWIAALRNYPEFEDGSWTYSGLFIHSHEENK